MKPSKLTPEKIQNTLTNAIENAVAFIEAEVAPDRIKAQRYFEGKVDKAAPAGRSQIVATKCRDTVRAVKPGLMRVFMQSGSPVEFIPRTPQAVKEAEEKTDYAKYVFDRNNGFMLLSDAFDDALRKKVGILKAWFDETEQVDINEYSGLTQDQVAYLGQMPGVELLEYEMEENGLWEVKASKTTKTGEIKIKAIAPEDFFVDRGATSINDCYVCGHSTEMRVGDVVAMGFDFSDVYETAGKRDNSEATERIGQDDDDEGSDDRSMHIVLLTEAYMRMDIEGTGIPRLYKFICGGDKYKILGRELADTNPFAVFEVDPEPHTFFGRSLIDIITGDQDAATSLLRGLLDNMQQVNTPALEVVDGMVNMDDLLNNEIGSIKRVKQPGMIREMVVGSMASAVLPAIGYYDEVIRGKTGVSGAGMGLDADMLQSQTAQGVNAAVQAANQVSELIARHLAEGGMRQLFQIICQLAKQNPNPEEMMRVNGAFTPVDTSAWSADTDLICNVGLGTGQHDQKALVLRETLQTQIGIWQSYGPQNGIVSMTNIRNTFADILQLSGIYNVDRYYAQMTPQIEQQLLQQAAQSQAPQASDPNAAFLQAEQMKTSARVQADQQKTMLDWQKAQMDDDRQRDKMAQDLALDAAKLLADTGIRLNTAAVKAEQAVPRV